MLFIAYLESYIHFRRHGTSSLNAIIPLVWQQALCGYSLMSATTPCIKSFLGRFRTDDLGDLTSYTSSADARDYALGTLGSKHTTVPTRSIDRPAASDIRHAGRQNGATAYAEAGNPDPTVEIESARSSGSEQMIIHRKVDINVVDGKA
jgi:hypothetical protein